MTATNDTRSTASEVGRVGGPSAADEGERYAEFRKILANATKGTRRSSTQVTSDRLADALDKHYDTTDGPLRDAIGTVRAWLEDL